MNDQVKSDMLTAVMEWQTIWSSATGKVILDDRLEVIGYEQEDGLPNLYEPHRFTLAWKVVEFTSGCLAPIKTHPDADIESLPVATYFCYWWEKANLWASTQEQAQRAILDKCLDLFNRAGLIKKVEVE